MVVKIVHRNSAFDFSYFGAANFLDKTKETTNAIKTKIINVRINVVMMTSPLCFQSPQNQFDRLICFK